jgi:hypothetical protein
MIGESTMNAATASEIARLETMTITKVVERFESLFGEKCRSRKKRYLIRRIAWRLQANAEGNLSERAKARASELARLRCAPAANNRNPLTSDVHVIVVGAQNRINFPTPNDESSVRYVLSRIRSHCN